jgi:hypothetical protein
MSVHQSEAIKVAQSTAVRIIEASNPYDWHIDLVQFSGRHCLMANHVDGNPERSSFFGDKNHIARLMMSYPHMVVRYGDARWTEAGLEYMQGVYCPSLIRPSECARVAFEVSQ